MRTRIALVCAALLFAGCEGRATTNAPEGTLPAETTGETPEITPETPTSELPPFAPAAPKMRRLTRVEYENTVRDLFGDSIEVPALEPDTAVNGSTAIGNAQIATSPRGVEQYETAAFEVSAQIMRSPARANLLGCSPQTTVDTACTTTFIREMGERVWRRPLTDAEVETYMRIALTAARDLNDFWTGLEYGLAGLLQSPNFLYRTEYGTTVDAPAKRRLTPHEVASRLSYFLWASTPDDMLLEAAASGELETPEQVRAQAQRMLKGPRAERGLRALWTEFFALQGIDAQVKDSELYPEFDEGLAASMQQETMMLLDEFALSDRDFREIYSTKETFVDGRLAELYGVDVDTNAGDFVKVTLDDTTPRRGILGHASFLSLNAHVAHNSPTERGKFVRQSVLCQPIPPPPPSVDTSIPEDGVEGKTLREKLSIHMEIEGCSSCHLLTDPIGFGFENFDAIGRYRTEDNGHPVDATGDLDGTTFQHAGELGVLVAEHDQTAPCVVRKVYRHALGHVEANTEERLIRELVTDWESDGYRLRELLLDLVSSEGFLYVEGGQ